MNGPRTVRLDDPCLPWEEIVVPDGRPPASRALLHAEGRDGASVQAVRFAPGWSREPAGHYDAAEEFVVMRGSLVVSGVRFVPGDYGFLPARALRTGSRAGPEGCLAVAWFDRPPRWSRGAAAVEEQVVRCRVAQVRHHRGATLAAWGESGHLEPSRWDIRLDLVSPADVAWAWVPEKVAVPQLTPPLLVRTWPEPQAAGGWGRLRLDAVSGGPLGRSSST